jgi:hypothetical protein
LLETIRNRLLAPERETRFRQKLQSLLAAKPVDPCARIAALDAQIGSPALTAKLAEAEAEKAQLQRAPALLKPQRLAADAVGIFRAMARMTIDGGKLLNLTARETRR